MRWKPVADLRWADPFGERAERDGVSREQAKRRMFAEAYGGPVIEGEVEPVPTFEDGERL